MIYEKNRYKNNYFRPILVDFICQYSERGVILESVYIPEYFDLENTQSYYLDKLFTTKGFKVFKDDDGKYFFSLDILRSFYRQDKELFNKLVLELTIRGFIIENKKKSSIFPTSYITDKPDLITAKEGDLNFENIDFEFFHLGLLLSTFKIKSSKFFENIPLTGFLTINPRMNIHLFSESLLKSGFQIKQFSDEPTRIIDLRQVVIPEIFFEISGKPYLNFIELKNFIKLTKSQKEFLNTYKVVYLHQLTPDFLKLVNANWDGETYREFIKQIKKSLIHSRVQPFLLQAFRLLSKNGLPEAAISIAFSENKYNVFRKFANKGNINYLSEFTNEKFEAFTISQGIGIKKIIDVLDIICNYSDVDVDNFVTEILEEEARDEEVTTPQYLYLALLLSMQSGWLALFKDEAIIKTEKEIEAMKVKFKVLYESKKKKLNLISKEVNQSLGSITILNLELLKDEIINTPRIDHLTIRQFLSWFHFPHDNFFLEDKYEEMLLCFELSFHELEQVCLVEEASENFEPPRFMLLYKQILWQLIKFQTIMNDMDGFLLSQLEDQEQVIYDERIGKENVLDYVGNILGVTRERIRQIEKKILLKLAPFLDFYIVPAILFHFYIHQVPYLHDEELNMPLAVKNILKNCEDLLGYDKEYDVFYPKDIPDYAKGLELWKNLVSNLSIIEPKDHLLAIIQGYFQEYPNEITTFFSDHVEELLVKSNYSLIEERYFVDQKATLEKRVVGILSFFENEMITLSSDEDIQKYRELYAVFYPHDPEYLNTTNILLARKLGGLFVRAQGLILSGPSTYTLYNYKQIPRSLFSKIYEYLTAYFEENKVISYKKVYTKFEEELVKENLTPYMMYSLLKHSYEVDFSFGKGNTMNIFVKGAEKMTTEEIIFSKVVQMDGKVSKLKLTEELGYEFYTIDQAVVGSEKLLMIHGIVSIRSFSTKKLSESFQNMLTAHVETSLMKQHCIILKELYYQLKFDSEFSKELQMNSIISCIELSVILKVLFPNLTGHTKFLYDETHPVSTFDVFLSSFFEVGKVFTRKEIIEHAEKLGYSETTTYLYMRTWETKGKIISIDGDRFILREMFELTEEIKVSVNQYLTELLTDKEYISLNSLTGYRKRLPSIQRPLVWTPELIRYVALEIGYKVIRPSNVSPSVDPLIIMNPLFEKKTYRDLLKKAMDEYYSSMHNDAVYEYLIEKELIVRRKNGLTDMPEEVLVENVICVNGIYMVERIGENES